MLPFASNRDPCNCNPPLEMATERGRGAAADQLLRWAATPEPAASNSPVLRGFCCEDGKARWNCALEARIRGALNAKPPRIRDPCMKSNCFLIQNIDKIAFDENGLRKPKAKLPLTVNIMTCNWNWLDVIQGLHNVLFSLFKAKSKFQTEFRRNGKYLRSQSPSFSPVHTSKKSSFPLRSAVTAAKHPTPHSPLKDIPQKTLVRGAVNVRGGLIRAVICHFKRSTL